jgi:hypothetical protein
MEVCLGAHVRLLAARMQQLLWCSFAIISSCTHDEQRAGFFVQLTPCDYQCVYCLQATPASQQQGGLASLFVPYMHGSHV